MARQLALQFVVSMRASAIQAAQDALRSRSADRVQELRRRSYIEPREFWSLEDLAQPQHDGSLDPEGPILMAVDGIVYNVGGDGAKFYAPGGEYHCFAGRDATRLLAKQRTEEETAAQLAVPLSVGERLVLAGWKLVLERKYVKVGVLSEK
jgi:predicted heme/steroid binding protein